MAVGGWMPLKIFGRQNIPWKLNNLQLSAFSGVASYGALGHVPPSTSNNFILVHFGLNLRANYPSIV